MAGGAHPADDRLRETVVGSRTVHRGRYLTSGSTIERPDGSRAQRDICGHPGAVAIVALDGEGRVLMVRQFRLATGAVLLEIPAGTLDVAADGTVEDPDVAARRELEEETGQNGTLVGVTEIHLARGRSTSAIINPPASPGRDAKTIVGLFWLARLGIE
jgi:ADP-ribose pyrophosphatase